MRRVLQLARTEGRMLSDSSASIQNCILIGVIRRPIRNSCSRKSSTLFGKAPLLAPDSGTYEFVVRTEHATRLYVNNIETPLIDAWVKSGDDAEHHGEIRLLGGRAYAIKLELLAASRVWEKTTRIIRRRTSRTSNTSISLLWKRPNHTLEVDAAAKPVGSESCGSVCHCKPISAGRPQRRLRARHVDLESLGRGHDRGGDRSCRLCGANAAATGRRQMPTDADSEPNCASSARGSPSGRFAGRSRTSSRSSTSNRQFEAVPDLLTARQASRAAGAEVAAVPVSRSRRRARRRSTTSPRGSRSACGIRCPTSD